MTNDPQDSIYTQHIDNMLMRRGVSAPEKEHWLKRHGKKVGSGIACSAAVAFFMHL